MLGKSDDSLVFIGAIIQSPIRERLMRSAAHILRSFLRKKLGSVLRKKENKKRGEISMSNRLQDGRAFLNVLGNISHSNSKSGNQLPLTVSQISMQKHSNFSLKKRKKKKSGMRKWSFHPHYYNF